MLNYYIKVFLEVADSGSFSAASERLYTTKVSVMNQINSLESQVGVPLFVRTNHGVRLTESGKSFYNHSRKIMRLSREAIEEARKLGGRNTHIIRVGTSLMRPCAPLVKRWEDLGKNPNEYQFNIVPFDDGPESLKNLLESLGKKIDCFVTPCGSTSLLMNCGFLPISKLKYEIALSKKHPLASKTILHWEDLYGESLLLVRRGESYIVDEIRDEITKNHPAITVVDSNGYYDANTFNQCEQEGFLMGTMRIWADMHPSLVTIPVAWDYEMPYGIMYEKEPSAAVREFIDVISDVN